MKFILPSGNYYAECVTSNSTGAAANADSLPTAKATRNGADDGNFALTVAALDAGHYTVTGTVPSNYAQGDVVQVSLAATIGGVNTKAVIDECQVGPVSLPASGVTVGGFAEGAAIPPVAIAEGCITAASFASGAAVPLPAPPPAGYGGTTITTPFLPASPIVTGTIVINRGDDLTVETGRRLPSRTTAVGRTWPLRASSAASSSER